MSDVQQNPFQAAVALVKEIQQQAGGDLKSQLSDVAGLLASAEQRGEGEDAEV